MWEFSLYVSDTCHSQTHDQRLFLATRSIRHRHRLNDSHIQLYDLHDVNIALLNLQRYADIILVTSHKVHAAAANAESPSLALSAVKSHLENVFIKRNFALYS